MKQFNKKVLSATVSMMMTWAVCGSIQTSIASDIEIYKDAAAGKTTITLMLDTSGSMSTDQVGKEACDLPRGISSGDATLKSESSGTTPSYTKNYCEVDGEDERRYYYQRSRELGNWRNSYYEWYKCGAGNNGSTNRNDCNISIGTTTPPNLNQYTARRPNESNSCNDNNICYYFKDLNVDGKKYYDRLTRLKDALFSLMDSALLDEKTMAIGIGNYSSQSDQGNNFTGADGSSGKILVPAALVTSAQRNAIKTAIAGLVGSNGTPTANAYAEVAAYMLGTTTDVNYTGEKESYVYAGVFNNGTAAYGTCTAWSGLNCRSYGSPYIGRGLYNIRACNLNWGDGRNCLVETVNVNSVGTGISGFNKSISTSKISARYATPLSSASQCNGQGIYFLSDGNPNSSPTPEVLMKAALGTQGSLFNVPTTGTLPNGSESGHGMPAVGEFAKALRNVKSSASAADRNPLGVEIKTAVVGFGSVFDVDREADAELPESERVIRLLTDAKGITREYYNCNKIASSRVDARNACNWGARSHASLPGVGGYGEGGFYSAQSPDDIINSIVKFLDEVKPEFDPVATGSPTVPVDSLNPIQLQPYGYYASFIPKPQESTQLWLGNLNKYNLHNGELFDKEKLIRLIKTDGSLDRNANGYWEDGVKGQLKLGDILDAGNQKKSQRIIFTNREITGETAPYEAIGKDNQLVKVDLQTLFSEGVNANGDALGKFKNDPDKNYWLNLLGYNVSIGDEVTLDLLAEKTELRQVGSVMHSSPILLTQEGKIVVNGSMLTTTGRKDYILFGSTQGILHVVDDEGKEVFAFVPHEMMENQKVAFLTEASSTGGKDHLFYGIDAPWTAHTQYVSKSDGTLTVKDSGRKASDEEDAQNLIGMQWVYGGLRMGGKSYYALDLTDIDSPELKFHINPDAENAPAALKQMGQSWSKPTLAYVNWGDTRKLVMFVGGGYDPIYETHNADPSSTKGNGVYMFDAHNGDLLWWASDSEKAGAARFTDNDNLKYSIVSQINAIDRDGDGLTDHIYFGDLAGQAFRVDFNNRATDTANFATRVVRLFTEHQGSGLSPRFYEMPSVSIHQDDGSYFAAVAFSSGNRSSPLAGLNSTTSANDAVFVVYDNDVARQDLYKSGITLNTQNEVLTELNFDSGVARRGQNNTYNGGWKAYFDKDHVGRYKGMNDLYALDGMLYVNVYDRDGTGIGGSCGAGVAGDSYLYQYCLPTGKCDFYSGSGNKPSRVKLGAGILGTGLGQGFKNDPNTVSLVVNRDEPSALDCDLPANKNLPQCQLFDTQVKLQQMRWYESR
ncbi:pilus assembly protein [Acinetobacter indicus]|uniref:pilus assembly protein n=1 Tax=Acinetobacter indicus TaxID=756892 RepID=UPI002091DDF6|nr:PilC/PilY family type IV pilus protein [Acinetobacter indicus]